MDKEGRVHGEERGSRRKMKRRRDTQRRRRKIKIRRKT